MPVSSVADREPNYARSRRSGRRSEQSLDGMEHLRGWRRVGAEVGHLISYVSVGHKPNSPDAHLVLVKDDESSSERRAFKHGCEGLLRVESEMAQPARLWAYRVGSEAWKWP